MTTATTARQAVGRHGENVAARTVADLGWEVLARNWRCTHGEIDLVAVDGDELVVIEVKTRRSARYGTPAEAVTPAKVARLRRLAAAYLGAQQRRYAGVRLDVIAVTLPRAGSAHVEHLRAVG